MASEKTLNICREYTLEDCLGAICSERYKDADRKPVGKTALPRNGTSEYMPIKVLGRASDMGISRMIPNLPRGSILTDTTVRSALSLLDRGRRNAALASFLFKVHVDWCQEPPPAVNYEPERYFTPGGEWLHFSANPDINASWWTIFGGAAVAAGLRKLAEKNPATVVAGVVLPSILSSTWKGLEIFSACNGLFGLGRDVKVCNEAEENALRERFLKWGQM